MPGKIRRTLWVGSVVLAAVGMPVLLPGHVLAQVSDSAQTGVRLADLTLEQLGDVDVVSVSKQPAEIWQTAAAVHVITHEDIRRSGATSIPEVLRLAPGVEVARIDSDHWAVGVRGFGDQFSKSLLVLIDGRSIYTPLFAGMYWPAHDTLLDDVERVEVIRGPGGTVWGANAVNGVINIITKSAAETRGTLASVGGGSIDRGTVALRIGGGNGRGTDYRVWINGANRGGQFHPDGVSFDEWWTGQAGFRADRVSGPDTVTLQGEVSKGNHGQRVMITTLTPPAQQAVNGSLEASGVNLLGRWQRNLGTGHGVRLQVYYDRTSWLATHFGETRNTLDVDFVHHVTRGRHQVSLGTGLRLSPSTFTQTVPTLDFTPRDQTDSVYSASGQDEVQLVRGRLWLTAGAKLEHNNYTGLEVQPNVRVAWRPLATHTLWAAVTRAVRTPSRIERGIGATSLVSPGPPLPIFLEAFGNDGFDAERLLGYEAGYRAGLTPRLYVDVAAFHNEHDDLATFGRQTVVAVGSPVPTHAVVRFPYVNGVLGSTNGIEVAPDWRPAPWVQLKGSYSHIHFNLAPTPVNVDPNIVSRYEGSSPHHQMRGYAMFNLPHGFEIDASYRFVGALRARGAKAYRSADLMLQWKPQADVTLSVAGQNLLEPHHVEFGPSAGPAVGISRSVYAAVTWRRKGQ